MQDFSSGLMHHECDMNQSLTARLNLGPRVKVQTPDPHSSGNHPQSCFLKSTLSFNRIKHSSQLELL